MVDLRLDLNVDEILEAHEDLRERLEAKLPQAAQLLAIQAHAYVVDEANQRLHARRQMFMDNLRLEQVDDNTWAVVVGEKALWIEEGQSAHNMLNDLLSSPKAKTARDGSKYLVIPFRHSKGGPTSQTTQQKQLVQIIRSELKRAKIPYKKIEKNDDGSPKLGLLHRLDIMAPTPKQLHHSNHLLEGLSIYQSLNKAGKAQRDIVTFRVASSKHYGTGKWEHPGNLPMHFLESAHAEAERIWRDEMLPDILDGLDLE